MPKPTSAPKSPSNSDILFGITIRDQILKQPLILAQLLRQADRGPVFLQSLIRDAGTEPLSIEWQIALGYCAYYLDQDDLAELYFAHALHLGQREKLNEYHGLLIYLGQVFLKIRAGKGVAVEHDLKIANKQFPDHPLVLYCQALYAKSLANFAGAVEFCDKILTKEKSWAEIWFLRAQLQFDRDLYDDSRRDFLKAIELEPNNPDAYWYLGYIALQNDNDKDAEDAWNHALKLHPGHANSLDALGEFYWDNDEFEKALGYLERGLQADPTKVSLWLHIGIVHYEMDALEDALFYLNTALQFDPKNAEALIYRGLTHLELERFINAETDWKTALQQRPKDAEICGYLGELYLKRRDYVNADHYYSEAAAAEPDDAEYVFNQGRVAVLRNEYQKAVPILERALELDPNNGDILFFIARAYLETGKVGDASRALQKLPGINNNSELTLDIATEADILDLSGDLHKSEKKYSQAIGQYKKALKTLKPNQSDYAKMTGAIRQKITHVTNLMADPTQSPSAIPEIPKSEVNPAEEMVPCSLCESDVGISKAQQCGNCGNVLCKNCAVRCSGCGKILCNDYSLDVEDACSFQCQTCGAIICADCLKQCDGCNHQLCPKCAELVHLSDCKGCGKHICYDCSPKVCKLCGKNIRRS
jgi:tetratricopeptide (TPR) repeat protein